MKSFNHFEDLKRKVETLLSEDRYSFSDEDKALLRIILAELEDLSNQGNGIPPDTLLRIISLLLRFLSFFGVDDIDKLF